MKLHSRPLRKKSQKGAVAVEAALCMTFILLPLFSFIYLLGNYFWYYSAVQKAVHDAALYMSSAPLSEIKSNAAGVLARDILSQETADFRQATTMAPSTECGYKIGNTVLVAYMACNNINTPVGVQASVSLTIHRPFFFDVIGNRNKNMILISQMPYVGR